MKVPEEWMVRHPQLRHLFYWVGRTLATIHPYDEPDARIDSNALTTGRMRAPESIAY